MGFPLSLIQLTTSKKNLVSPHCWQLCLQIQEIEFLQQKTVCMFPHHNFWKVICIQGCVAVIWHFKFTLWSTNILKCKFFFIGLLNELGNLKQKIFYISKCDFLHFTATDPYILICYVPLFKIGLDLTQFV